MSLGDTVVGTPAYMAPERLLNVEYDGWLDVYSFGVIMYRMLCGRVLFEIDGNVKYVVVMMQLIVELSSMSALNPSVLRGLADLVGRTFSKDPGRRPSARALSVMLKNAASFA